MPHEAADLPNRSKRDAESALESFERLLFQNSIFNDDTRLESFAVKIGSASVPTLQPNIRGAEVSCHEMATFMGKLA